MVGRGREKTSARGWYLPFVGLTFNLSPIVDYFNPDAPDYDRYF